MFATNTSLIIGGSVGTEKGKLIADGSIGTISFTSNQATHTAGYWGCIYFDNYSDDGSYLKNVVVEYGGYNYNANIYCISASPSIQNSIIRNSSQHGICLQSNSNPFIATNTVTDNNSYGIYCNDTSPQPVLENNTIANNATAMRITPNTDFFNNTISGNIKKRIELLGGNITNNRIWKDFNYTYVILGTVSVKGTDTPILVIAPNVTIMFATNTSLIIGGSGINAKGKLMADGSSGTISFTSDEAIHTAGYWGGIIFDNYSDDGIWLRNIVVEHGGYNYNANIYCINASPTIQDSIIGSSSQHGIRCNNSSPQIINNIIKDNSSHGIYLEGSSKPRIATNTITNNNSYGIYCNDNSPQPVLENNTIATNTTAMRISPNTDFSTNTIHGNINKRIELLGGNITNDKFWKDFDYTYVILGTVSVKDIGAPTLIIASSVTIMFATNTSLIIGGSGINDKGKLIADGSSGTITFTSDQATHTAGYWGWHTAGYWGCIYFDKYSDDESNLKNIVVEYGGYNYNANIYCINASPTIQDSIIGSSSQHGIRCNNSSPQIINNIIKDNSSHGIYLEGSSKPRIATNTVTGNNYGIYCNDSGPQPTMENNTIATNTTAMRISPNTDFFNNVIYGNINKRIDILGGNITNNRIWKNFDYTYVILGTVSVKGTDTPILVIEPNVTIMFATNTSLIIGGSGINDKGKLMADGSLGTISFTSNQAIHTAGYWGGIYFEDYSNDNSILDTAVIEYGGYAYGTNIYCVNASPKIQNSIIGSSSQYGIRCNNSSPLISNDLIKNNRSHGVCLQGDSDPTITASTITGNDYGIYCAVVNSSPLIATNTITDNKSYPVRIGANSVRKVFNNTCSNNTLNAIYLLGETIDTSETWASNGVPYVIGGNVSVMGAGTPTLTIEPTVEVRFAQNTCLIIGGTVGTEKGRLIADGSLGTILFTSNQAAHTAGYWGCILFNNYSDDESLLRNVVVEYGGRNTYATNIYCISASPSIQNSIIRNSSGHGIRCNNSFSLMTNDIINNNLFNGIYLEKFSTSTITNNLISWNGYSGIHCISSSPNVYNNIIVQNGTKSSSYNGIRVVTNGTPIIDFNDVWGNGLTANYYGCGTGTTDISANPQFIGGVDFHLASTSPCINKGLNTAPGIPLTDKDVRARIIGGTVDMGAYEYGTTPPPTTGTLNVISSPTGVNIFINGINKVKTTPAVLSLEAGTYILLLTKPNYDPCTATVTINIGSITQIYGTLTPCYGTLSVTSTPTGASIFIDGVDKGTATPAVLSLQTGSYTLSLTMPNYCTYTTTITIGIGSSSPTSIPATLTVYSVGTLSVTSNPTGASIFIDGSNIGTTTPAELSLQVGSHTLSLTKLNYYSYATTTTIGSSSITHHGTLTPYPPVAIISAPLRPVKVNDSVTIDGTKSYAANGNPIKIYSWKQIDGTISGTTTTSTIPFTPTKAGTYAFELTVTDDMESSGSATVSVSVTDTLLTISPVTPEIGSSFSVDVILSKVPEFDAIGVYLSFDPNMLEVIKLTPGAFPVGGSQIMPQFNNDNGTIDYAVVLLGTTTQGSGTIFTINFKAKTITGTTTLNFDFNPPRNTVILKGAGSVPVAIIEGSVPITDVLYGSLDGFVQFDIPRKTPDSHLGIEVTIDETDLKAITDKNGYFLIEKISPMIYQKISAYAPGASTRYWGSVTITVGTKTTLSILTLLNADVNGDCMVDLRDFGYFKSAFHSGTSSSGWNDSGTHTRDGYINADFNGDGTVGLMDFGYFKSNYLKTTPSQRSPLFAPPLTLSNSVNILTTPILKVVQQEKVVKMGDEFEVNIDLLHAPDFDSVGVYLSFDPNRLEVIGITQGLLLQGGSPIVSRFNNVSGTIDYAVGLISGTAQGTGTVLTIKLKAKGTGTTTLNFDFNPPRSIEILNGTTSVPCSTQGGTTIIIELLGSSSSGILIAGDGKTRVEIDTGAITGAGYIEIDTSGISDDPIVIIANTKNDADTRINRIEGTLRRFEIHDATITTTATVRIAIPYLDENPKDGVVDGTGIQVSSLKICWLTGTGTDATWWPVKNSWIDYTNSLVYANVSHFSYYVLMGSVMPTLTFVYPNPCLGQQVHFKGLTPHATIKIFNIAGELVKEIEHTNGTDEEVWTFSCEIASGIYIYLITDPAGNKKTGKIGVIR
ncbi:MAG: right-handed parallel beta-helix repeat-containing protein [Candidatus Desantisbacteria bacterium]